MKKKTALALAAVMALSVAGTALAAPANPFVDVPAKHWSYDAVNQLAKAGIISGYGDGTFRGDKTITRYEMAVLVGKALANTGKLDAATKATLDKLQAEYSAELNNLGVRVDALEKKSDNVKITGDIRIQYTDTTEKSIGGEDSTDTLKARSRVYFTGKVNDQWSYTGRLQNTSDLKDAAAGDTTTSFNQAYVTGNVFGGVYSVGRQDLFVLDGLVIDNTADSDFKGAAVSYKLGEVNATARYGKQALTVLDENDVVIANQVKYTGLELKSKAGAFDVGAAYHKATVDEGSLKVWEVAAATKLSPVFTASAGYAKSDADDNNKAYTLGVNYKNFDKSQAGSFGAWAQYRRTETNALLASTYDKTDVADGGAKAIEVGVLYAPWKNVEWKTYYVDAKSILNDNNKDTYFVSQLRYFF